MVEYCVQRKLANIPIFILSETLILLMLFVNTFVLVEMERNGCNDKM